ncbi:MAG: glycoside hydrolase family 13 protein [Lachnospiraceae bacterium]|nr:glycoside hydrolase family 13 protein [Lachnospiraceae bacterium]
MDINEIVQTKRAREYAINMRPVLNRKALFSDETANYRTPFEPEIGDRVTIKFRTWMDNVDYVFFICGSERKQMKKAYSKGVFDYYTYTTEPLAERIHYFFEVRTGNQKCFYNKLGVSKDLQEYNSFEIAPGFKTPDWAKGAIMYQIYTDRFCNGDTSNDVEDREYIYINEGVRRVRDWNRLPEPMDVRDFYGGDLKGIWDKLDYLQDLGVEVLYLNPIFVSPSNHKYDSQDYDYIDPHYGVIVEDGGECLPEGDNDNSHASKYIHRVVNKKNLEASNRFFAEFVEEVHRRGMKIILDGVFNHCGSFNKWLDRERLYEHTEGYEKGAYVSGDSPYRSFFKFNYEHGWPYNEYYDGWWGHDTLPKLYYEQSPELEEYILNIARKWLKPPYSVDGWRLDVAADLGFSSEYNHEFWRKFRKVVKEANPDALILAEHYGNANSWLRGDQWDTLMNYDAFMEPVSWFLTGMEKHSDEYREDMYGNAQAFKNAMIHHMANFCAPSLQTAMNELSNHDHSRFLTRTNRRAGRVGELGSDAASIGVNKGIFREAVVIQMTWVGAPTLYYGDEAGVCGFTDPDNRRTYPWGEEDQSLISFYKEAICIHKENPVLTHGSVRFLTLDYQFLSYGRFDDENQMVVVVNNGREEKEINIPVWKAEVPREASMERLMLTLENGFSLGDAAYEVKKGILYLKVPPVCSMILRRI